METYRYYLFTMYTNIGPRVIPNVIIAKIDQIIFKK